MNGYYFKISEILKLDIIPKISTIVEYCKQKEKEFEAISSCSIDTSNDFLFIRLDGRSFRKLTKLLNLEKPVDDLFHLCFKDTIDELMTYYRIDFAYHQFDEITFSIKDLNALDFNGRKQKLISVISGHVSSLFCKNLIKYYGKDIPAPHFDLRMFYTDKEHYYYPFVWRMLDGYTNFVKSVSQVHLKDVDLIGVSNIHQINLLNSKYSTDDFIKDTYSDQQIYGIFAFNHKRSYSHNSTYYLPKGINFIDYCKFLTLLKMKYFTSNV